MNNIGKRQAQNLCIEYKLIKPTKEEIEQVLELLGFTVVEFNFIYNDEDVTVLIEQLNLSDEIMRSKGFTYVSSKYRLVFVSEDLSQEEKRIVLAHELGHIYMRHFDHSNIIGLDVQEEYEANEFAHYLVNQGNANISRVWLISHKLLVTVVLTIILLAVGIIVILQKNEKEELFYGEYYITESGQKYHEKECIFVKDKGNVRRITVEEFETGDYEPCKICLPNINH